MASAKSKAAKFQLCGLVENQLNGARSFGKTPCTVHFQHASCIRCDFPTKVNEFSREPEYRDAINETYITRDALYKSWKERSLAGDDRNT